MSGYRSSQPGAIMDNEQPFSPNRDGKLTVGRWQFLNTLLSLDHEDASDVIEKFHRIWGISPKRLYAELAAYRLDCPETVQ
jgi:hypothetical protein